MAWSVWGVFAKLMRFDQNLEEFERALTRYVNSNSLRLVPEFDADTGRHIVWLDVDPPGPEFGLITGEAAHNLRSALDHIAWQLANLDGPPPDPNAVQFPIFSWKPTDFTTHRFVNGMREQHIAVLEQLQPYHPGHGETLLETLAWINNTDKHRLLHAAASWITDFEPERLMAYPGSRIASAEFGREAGVLQGRAEIGYVRILPVNPEPQMHMQGKPSVGIAFGDPDSPIYGLAMDGVLRNVKEMVEGVVEIFDRPGLNGLRPWP